MLLPARRPCSRHGCAGARSSAIRPRPGDRFTFLGGFAHPTDGPSGFTGWFSNVDLGPSWPEKDQWLWEFVDFDTKVPYTWQAHADTLSDGLIGYWQFDGSGRDASGGGRDLELVGGVGFAPGLFGSALDLHGNRAQYARRPVDDPVYDFGANAFTIQAWARFDYVSYGVNQIFVEKFEGMGGPGWTLAVVGDTGEFPVWHFYANPSAILYSPRQVIAPHTWHHVLTRRSADVFEIFYDGTRIVSGSDPDPVPDTSFPLLIGRRGYSGYPAEWAYPVNGRMDEVAIWSRALSDGEIATLIQRRCRHADPRAGHHDDALCRRLPRAAALPAGSCKVRQTQRSVMFSSRR